MMQSAIEQADEPIYLNPNPETRKHALLNLQAFSDEGRRKTKLKECPEVVRCTSTASLKRCFGWTKVAGQEHWNLGPRRGPPCIRENRITKQISRDEEYYAIIYEFIPEIQRPPDRDMVQSQLDFYWLVGFCLAEPLRLDNWKGRGILVDMADLICPWSAGWFPKRYERRLAEELEIEAWD
ncbi:hypothetical protein CPLU01_15304 [Colletotrichum plurivorum]|uniref:Uncharacterized protein n=1 Tax=Colletotrichum plurivorum TaxID=2175906 RepID=A0A8H6MVF6_9PEZI|nr:hypothetical protein CPLU01_15304 [Colletotrichum plurivorum]